MPILKTFLIREVTPYQGGVLLYQIREHDKNRGMIHTQNLSNSLELSIVKIIEKSNMALLSAVDQAEMQIARGGIDSGHRIRGKGVSG